MCKLRVKGARERGKRRRMSAERMEEGIIINYRKLLSLSLCFSVSPSLLSLPLFLISKSDGKNSKKNLKSPRSWFPTYPSLTSFDSLLLTIVLLVQLFCLCASPLFHSLPFLPLLITSFSCSLAINWTWLLTLKCYFIN